MTVVRKNLGVILLLISCAAAQGGSGTATVQSVTVAREGTDVRVEITLSGPVTPSVDTAENPNRILLDLPDTRTGSSPKVVAVNDNGVRRVRTGQHSTAPLVTRVVIDLDQVHLYSVKNEGNRIILSVGAPDKREASRSVPVAATSGNLVGIFRKHHDSKPVTDNPADSSSMPAPPPAIVGPAYDPSKDNSTSTAAPSDSGQPAPPPQPVVTQQQPVAAGPQPSAVPTQQQPAKPPSFEQTQIAAASAPKTETASADHGTTPVSAAVTPTPVPPPQPVATAKAEPAPPPVPTPVPDATVAAPAGGEKIAKAETSSANNAPATAVSPVDSAAVETGDTGKNNEEAAPAISVGVPETTAAAVATLLARGDDPSLHTIFRVKYVAEGVAYLEGGRSQGLKEGMKLEVIDKNVPATQGESANAADPRVVAELEVSAVAETSSVTDIHTPKRPVKVGDLAYLSNGDAEALVQQRALSATRQYPAVISFTEGDTLDEEAREEVPRPPLPSVNRARGRIGFDTIETISHGTSSVTSTDAGMVFRGDITRIGGTYWNLSGFWRGRLNQRGASSQPQTMTDLLNRTYHLTLSYDNPSSPWVLGFGRLYLPWATSLDTIDGGYFGRRFARHFTAGLFAGSTPDPTSWNYAPGRQLAGSFVNYSGGSFESLRFSTTGGVAISRIHWRPERQFAFFENSLFYKQYLAVYHNLEMDEIRGALQPGQGRLEVTRSFVTVRIQPWKRLSFDLSHNHFRNQPTFDPRLAGTGLLDQLLFQGASAGFRLELPLRSSVYTNFGRSRRTGDEKRSLNQMYGFSKDNLLWTGVRGDFRYSKFDSPFGRGIYRSLSLSREIHNVLRVEILGGDQDYSSALSQQGRSRYINALGDWSFGRHYFMGGGYTLYRSRLQNYNQIYFNSGYRF